MAAVIALHWARVALILALERACSLLDAVRWLPWPLTRLRCPNGMATISSSLDARWGTKVWGENET